MSTAAESGGASARPDPANLSFEEARDALGAVVKRLQDGTDSLQESLDLWEFGELLAKRCEDFLSAAAARVDDIVGSGDPPEESAAGPTRS